MKILNLHNHSDYSVFDGISKVKDYAQYISNNPDKFHQALSMSEHGTLHGQFETYKQAKKHNLKYIPACEFYVEKEEGVDSYNPHILIFGTNKAGYDELIAINNFAVKNGQIFGKRRKKVFLKVKQIKELQNLYVSGACLGGYWNTMIMQGKLDIARQRFENLHNSLGNKLLVEYQTFRGKDQANINEVNILFAERYGVKSIVTSDAHVIYEKDCKFLNPTRAMSMGINLNQYMKKYGEREHNTYFKTADDFVRESQSVNLPIDILNESIRNLDEIYKEIEDFNLEKEQIFNLGDDK